LLEQPSLQPPIIIAVAATPEASTPSAKEKKNHDHAKRKKLN